MGGVNMYLVQFMNNLFPNGGEVYSYTQLKNWLMSTLGVTAHQAAGIVGSAVRFAGVQVATCSKPGFAVFTR